MLLGCPQMGITNDPSDSSHPLAFPGVVLAPILYLSQRSAQQGDSVQLQCSVVSQAPATRIVYCKDGEEVFSQAGLKEKVTYSYDHTVSMGSSGNYSCGYEIKESYKQVKRSQLSPAKHLSVTVLSPRSQEICSDPGQSACVCSDTLTPLSIMPERFVLVEKASSYRSIISIITMPPGCPSQGSGSSRARFCTPLCEALDLAHEELTVSDLTLSPQYPAVLKYELAPETLHTPRGS
ncbi:uncharacterized protein LOC127036597 [Gopherus flavomarginatus]|uniref:uncharacterized protein LOC127036597 n=1 Tax=Gopherus flavomarginatus TaxID=286002 RepID=UPI0021CBC269|nr:uncharacterized protein LOC127036597 [Gopherus flavomarginatus]